MAIPASFIDDLVSRTDITDLVGSYVKLTKKSGSNMFGLCPFHSEKTPSFSVSMDKQIYYCFGCGKGGGAINFVMEIENLPYVDAIEFLARRAGMAVPMNDSADELAGKRKRILETNTDAAKHFHSMLTSNLAGQARDYLAARGISKAAVVRFGIGVAPDSWTMLLEAMADKGYSKQELIDAGLVKKGQKEGSVYDVFRNRLMFPIIDVRGGVVGFSGRILGDGEPKYLNTTATAAFSKGRNLFALNLAKKSKEGTIILVEGNIDVVSLHQAGFDNAVAPLGTALTEDQARLLSRYTEKVVIAYDSDDAGRRAALRAIPILEKTGLGIKVINMGGEKDPDEFLKAHKADSFRALIERSANHTEFRLDSILQNADMTTDEGRLGYLTDAIDLLARLGSSPEREIYGNKVAKIAGITYDSVKSEVDKKIRANRAKENREQEHRALSPAAVVRPTDSALKYSDEYSAAAEQGLIRMIMREPTYMGIALRLGFSEDEFTSDFHKKVFMVMGGRISEGRDASEAAIVAELDANEAAQLTAILHRAEAITPSEATVRDYIDKIRTQKFRTAEPSSESLLDIKKYLEKKDDGGEAQHG
ncbi:MAG: DNA primase [Oscillospiraceae bacterium]|nr:DNA primase [Oscillospiraceae bacterium]